MTINRDRVLTTSYVTTANGPGLAPRQLNFDDARAMKAAKEKRARKAAKATKDIMARRAKVGG